MLFLLRLVVILMFFLPGILSLWPGRGASGFSPPLGHSFGAVLLASEVPASFTLSSVCF